MKLMNTPGILACAVALIFVPQNQQSNAQCLADVNLDHQVNAIDLAAVLSAWATNGSSNGTDFNNDGFVNGSDLAFIVSSWGQCPAVVPEWATLLEAVPDPAVVTDANLRAAIVVSGFAWRIRDNSSGIEMLLIPGGTFNMGCSASNSYDCDGDESPTHQVTLSKAFYLGKTEVTQAQWQAKMGGNPSYFKDYFDSPSRPVEKVSWNDIAGFNTATGLRLPTEAEWEYACRGTTTTAFHSMLGYPNGTNDDSLFGNIAWDYNNSENQTHPVAGKAANAFGLYDMSGNVWEWCNDWYQIYAAGNATDPAGPATGTHCVKRGGGWISYSFGGRSSNRSDDRPDEDSYDDGFRVARTP